MTTNETKWTAVAVRWFMDGSRTPAAWAVKAGDEWHVGKRGARIEFAKQGGAERRASKLNKAESR